MAPSKLQSSPEHALNRNNLTFNCSGVSIVHFRVTHKECWGGGNWWSSLSSPARYSCCAYC